MARQKSERTVRQSVLDRLIDRNPRNSQDPPLTWVGSVQELKASVLRDLEWLLNTRRVAGTREAVPEELRHSLYHYGLPDITSMSADAPETFDRLLRYVEETIEIFEHKHQLRFIIEAMLNMEPNPERVVFDSVLEVVTGSFVVTGHEDA
jgi:type VI secretion system protein ImpF